MAAVDRIKGLFENATLKILSLALAVVLFLFVQGDKEAVVGVSVQVVLEPDQRRVLVSEPIDRIRVSIQGKFSNRKMEGTIGDGGRDLNLETVNGSIRLKKSG